MLDLKMKKMIEVVAYKQFESWYEEKNYKSQQQSTNKSKTTTDEDTTTTEIKQETSAPTDKEVKQADTKLRGLMSTFDPLNWAKGHFEMDGFRIGLGLKTALSKMPSFRVKKVPKKEEDNNDKGDKGEHRRNFCCNQLILTLLTKERMIWSWMTIVGLAG